MRQVPIGASADSTHYLSTKHLHMPNQNVDGSTPGRLPAGRPGRQAVSHLITLPCLTALEGRGAQETGDAAPGRAVLGLSGWQVGRLSVTSRPESSHCRFFVLSHASSRMSCFPGTLQQQQQQQQHSRTAALVPLVLTDTRAL